MRDARASIVIVAAGATLLLASCSSSTGSAGSSAAPASGSTQAASAASCSVKAVTPAVVAAIGRDQSLRRLGGVECDGDWAVVAPTVGPADGSTEGEIDITLVLKAEDGVWASQDRTAVCGTLPTGDGSPAYPGDAQVPPRLWRGGCQTN
jgi:hypothetical protein